MLHTSGGRDKKGKDALAALRVAGRFAVRRGRERISILAVLSEKECDD